MWKWVENICSWWIQNLCRALYVNILKSRSWMLWMLRLIVSRPRNQRKPRRSERRSPNWRHCGSTWSRWYGSVIQFIVQISNSCDTGFSEWFWKECIVYLDQEHNQIVVSTTFQILDNCQVANLEDRSCALWSVVGVGWIAEGVHSGFLWSVILLNQHCLVDGCEDINWSYITNFWIRQVRTICRLLLLLFHLKWYLSFKIYLITTYINR